MTIQKFAKYAAVAIVTLIVGSCVFGGDSTSATPTPTPSASASTPTATPSATPTATPTATPSATPSTYAPDYVLRTAWENISAQDRRNIRTGWELAKMTDTESEFITMFRSNVTVDSNREAREFLDWALDN